MEIFILGVEELHLITRVNVGMDIQTMLNSQRRSMLFHKKELLSLLVEVFIL
jgi:hypothetical protein